MVVVEQKIEIEKGVPIPRGWVKTAESPYRPNRSVMEKMKVGDSYAVSYDNEIDARRITSAGHLALRSKGWKMLTRRLVENGKQVVRVWRVA